MLKQKNLRRGLRAGLIMAVLFILAFAIQAQAADMTIHPYYYQGVMKKKVTVKASDGTKRTFSKGSKVTVKSRKTSGGKYTVYKRGKTYKIKKSRIELTGLITDGTHPYSVSTAENYVNSKGYTSKTKYLIWISTFKQHLYVFKGSKKNWKCIHHWSCSTGRFGTEFETKIGKTRIYGKSTWWVFDETHKAHWASKIRGGAIHSWTYDENDKRRPGHTGVPKSRGCVRIEIDHAKWVYDNVPNGTTVQIR